MNLKKKIISLVAHDLKQIEYELSQNLKPNYDLVSKVSRHILFSGGKRLRPLLMVLCAKACGFNEKIIYKFSIIFEYLHAATLLHDDLVDEAEMRRGKPVAHSIWGNPVTVLTGDFLLARALSTAAETGYLSIINLTARATSSMSQGEIFQLTNKRNPKLSEEQYYELIKGKTAALIQASCQSGAILARCEEKTEKAMSNYGYHLGIAFQMADDLLDYTAETKILGKKIGADLREGKLTLPLIYTLKKASKEDRSIIKEIILNENFTFVDFETLSDLLIKYKGIDYTKEKALNHIDKAKKELSDLKNSQAKEILLMLADYVLERKL